MLQVQTEKVKENQRLKEQTKHGKPGFPMVVYFNDFETYVDHRIPWHFHDEIEFVVVTKGVVEFSVGTQIFLLKEGEGIFINANVLHHMQPSLDAVPYMFSTVVNTGIFGTEQGVLLTSKYVIPYLKDDGTRFEILHPEIDWQKEALDKLYKINDCFFEKTAGYEYEMHNLICDVWFLLWKEIFSKRPIKKNDKSVDEERIYQALQYVQEKYMTDVSLEDWCNDLHISKSELCRCFRRNLRMTPFEYLMMFRINMAAKQLEETERNITEIAMNTGFHSNSYFCRQFRRYMNCTPVEYRRKFIE